MMYLQSQITFKRCLHKRTPTATYPAPECLNQDHLIDDEDETVDVVSKMADDEAKNDDCRSGNEIR